MGFSDWFGGGGMDNLKSSVTLTNCTFTGNSAHSGRAIACDSYWGSYQSNLQVTNCILWDGGDEIRNNDSSQIVVNSSNVQGGWASQGGSNINIDPEFVDAGNPDPNLRDYHLRSDSPCIDAGDNSAIPPDTNDLDGDGNTTELLPWDLDSRPRFADGDCNGTEVVDMGAYEFAYHYIGDFEASATWIWLILLYYH